MNLSSKSGKAVIKKKFKHFTEYCTTPGVKTELLKYSPQFNKKCKNFFFNNSARMAIVRQTFS